MRFTTVWVDVNAHLAAGLRPRYGHERPLGHGSDPKGGLFNDTEIARTGVYWSPDDDPASPGCGWSRTDSGRYAWVQLTAYRVPRALAALPAQAFQLGAAAAAGLRAQTDGAPVEVVLVCGNEVHDLGDAFRFYLGVALRVEG